MIYLKSDLNYGFHDPLPELFNVFDVYKCKTEQKLWTDIDTFEDISALGGIHGQEQTKLTITDYESYEEIEFEAWGDHSYGFTKADIESQFSIRYDEATQQTLLSINTDKVNKEDFVVLKDEANGKFELSHYSLEDGLTGLEVFLKDENATRNDYWVGEDVDQFGIKHFAFDSEIGFDKDFGFDSDNYTDQVSVTYDSVKGQTLIDVNTDTFTKDAVVVIDGQYDLGQIEIGSNSHLHLTLNESANVIRGTDQDDSLQGTSGNDTIYGLGGNDTIEGGAGNDTIDGGEGNDVIRGGDGDDTAIYDGQGTDTFYFGSGNDTLKVSNITGWSEHRDGDDLIIYAANGTDFAKIVGAYTAENSLKYIEYTEVPVTRIVSENSLVPTSGLHFFAGTSADDTIGELCILDT